MGMFDTVVIEGLKLPNLPKDISKYLKDNNATLPNDYQTKDLDCVLATFSIDKKGQVYTTEYVPTGKKEPYVSPFRGIDDRSFLEKIYYKFKFRKTDTSLPRFRDVTKPVKKKANITATINVGSYSEIAGRYVDVDYQLTIVKGKVTKAKYLNSSLESLGESIARKNRDKEFDKKLNESFEARRKFKSQWFYPILKEVYNPIVFFSKITIQAVCNKLIKYTYNWSGV